jgi:hypothetical protein
METEARFIKRHFLLIPSLTLADLPTLLLPLPDTAQFAGSPSPCTTIDSVIISSGVEKDTT